MPLIRGRVVGADGSPIAEARVAVGDAPVPMPDIAALTDADGGFVLAAPAPGTYEITATTDDSAVTRQVAVASDEVEVELVLVP